MLDHHHEQRHNIEHVEVFVPPPTSDNGIEYFDLVSPYDDDGYDKTVEQRVPSSAVITNYICIWLQRPSLNG